MNKQNKQIVLMVNSECNNGCKHCYLLYKGHREVKNTLELVDKFHSQGYGVIIAGSETLLNRGYLKAYERVGQKYLLTNGILISQSPEVVDELCQYGIKEVRISLHFSIQEDLKSVPERIVEKAISNAKKKGLRAKIATVITKNNHRNVLDMCKSAYDLGADGIKFIRFINSGRAKEFNFCSGLSEQERKKFFETVDSVRSLYPKDKFEILIHGNFGLKQGSRGEELSRCNRYCPAGINLFAVDPDDNVYGCPFLMGYQIGKLSEGKIIIDKDLCNGKRDRCLTDYLL